MCLCPELAVELIMAMSVPFMPSWVNPMQRGFLLIAEIVHSFECKLCFRLETIANALKRKSYVLPVLFLDRGIGRILTLMG